MGNLTTAFVFVMTLNVLMWLGQVAAIEINPEGTEFYHCNGSLIDELGSGGCGNSTVLNTDVIEHLPSAGSTVAPSSGSVFTDPITSILDFFKKIPGVNFLIQVAAAPYNMLKVLPLPSEFVYAIGTLWYGISIFLIIAFIWGRD